MDKLYLLLAAWMAAISVILFFMMGSDKKRAKSSARRIPEARLSFFALIGGAIGGTIAMRVFRHKTKHWYFAIGFPIIAVAQVCACVWSAIG